MEWMRWILCILVYSSTSLSPLLLYNIIMMGDGLKTKRDWMMWKTLLCHNQSSVVSVRSQNIAYNIPLSLVCVVSKTNGSMAKLDQDRSNSYEENKVKNKNRKNAHKHTYTNKLARSPAPKNKTFTIAPAENETFLNEFTASAAKQMIKQQDEPSTGMWDILASKCYYMATAETQHTTAAAAARKKKFSKMRNKRACGAS